MIIFGWVVVGFCAGWMLRSWMESLVDSWEEDENIDG